tara:strand:+ start:294 stop:482 length:189 start_codon:yes stop_codon:yes gene_type:complete
MNTIEFTQHINKSNNQPDFAPWQINLMLELERRASNKDKIAMGRRNGKSRTVFEMLRVKGDK